MREIDFSQAGLRFVSFSNGIDLTLCKLASEGCVRVPSPHATYRRVLERIRATWSGDARRKAQFYIGGLLEGHFDEEQPFDIFRPRDLTESPLGREVGQGIVREIQAILQETAGK
jgi:hypothetical protein